MTKSFARAQLRRYRQFHPWAKKLPKPKVKDSMGYYPVEEDHGLSSLILPAKVNGYGSLPITAGSTMSAANASLLSTPMFT